MNEDQNIPKDKKYVSDSLESESNEQNPEAFPDAILSTESPEKQNQKAESKTSNTDENDPAALAVTNIEPQTSEDAELRTKTIISDQQLETKNQEPQTPPMEVHHHTQTPRKKWSHYFFEFFMLFLAVTAGFLVENQREHYIEHQRAKQLAKSLLEDLKLDTANFTKDLQYREQSFKRLDTLCKLLSVPLEKIQKREVYRLSYKEISYSFFIRAKGTAEQLKNSGYLRYFSGSAIPRLLMEYDAKVEQVADHEKIAFNESGEFIRVVWQHFDANINDTNRDGNKPLPLDVAFVNMDESKLNYFHSLASSRRGLNWYLKNYYIKQAQEKAIEFIHAIEKEYN